MKFLAKPESSAVLKKGLTYSKDAAKNRELRNALLEEQFHFCAYSERAIAPTDQCEVEHFDPKIKYQDNYFNYYTVLSWANKAKLRKMYEGSRFFQNPEAIRQRIHYEDGEFKASDETDHEAEALIEFLGFNEEDLIEHRQYHIGRLKEVFTLTYKGDLDALLNYLSRHRLELSFPTAIEAEFGLDLTDIIQSLP